MIYDKDTYSTKLAEGLNKLYTDLDLYYSFIQENKYTDILSIKIELASILKYYIESRDDNFDTNFFELQTKRKTFFHQSGPLSLLEKYEEIQKMDISEDEKNEKVRMLRKSFQMKNKENAENIGEKGFISHSFYGKEGEYIRKYGLNYINYLSRDEQKEYVQAKHALVWLINFFDNITLERDNSSILYLFNPSNKKMKKEVSKIFFTTPGDTTFLYAIAHTPAILYEGPLREYYKELDFTQVKAKKEQIKQILLNRVKLISIKRKNEKAKNEEQKKRIDFLEERARKYVDIVVDFYCSGLPGFALIRIEDIRKSEVMFGKRDIKDASDIKYSFDQLIDERKKQLYNRDNITIIDMYLRYFFSDDFDFPTTSVLEDFCAKSEDLDKIPTYCVSCLDEFDIMKIIEPIKEMDRWAR